MNCFLSVGKFGSFDFAALLAVVRLGGKGKCAKCVSAKEIFKNAKRGFLFSFLSVGEQLSSCNAVSPDVKLFVCKFVSSYYKVVYGKLSFLALGITRL